LTTYVVATKREAKGDGISVADRVSDIVGAEVKSAANLDRVLVEMSPAAVHEVQRRFSDKLIVEPIIMHQSLSHDE
jgi:hypothetical protein